MFIQHVGEKDSCSRGPWPSAPVPPPGTNEGRHLRAWGPGRDLAPSCGAIRGLRPPRTPAQDRPLTAATSQSRPSSLSLSCRCDKDRRCPALSRAVTPSQKRVLHRCQMTTPAAAPRCTAGSPHRGPQSLRLPAGAVRTSAATAAQPPQSLLLPFRPLVRMVTVTTRCYSYC